MSKPDEEEDKSIYDEKAHLAAVSRQVQRAAMAKLAALEPFTVVDQATGEERSLDDPEVRRWVMAEKPEVYQRWLHALELGQKIERQRKMDRAQAKVDARAAELEANFGARQQKLATGTKRAQFEISRKAEVARYKREKRRQRFEDKLERDAAKERKERDKKQQEAAGALLSARQRKAEHDALVAGRMRAHTDYAQQAGEQTARVQSADRKQRIEKIQVADEGLEKRLQEKEMQRVLKAQQQQQEQQRHGSRRESATEGDAEADYYQQQQQFFSSSAVRSPARVAFQDDNNNNNNFSASTARGFGSGPVGATSTFARIFSESTGDAALMRESQKGYYDDRGTWHALTDDQAEMRKGSTSGSQQQQQMNKSQRRESDFSLSNPSSQKQQQQQQELENSQRRDKKTKKTGTAAAVTVRVCVGATAPPPPPQHPSSAPTSSSSSPNSKKKQPAVITRLTSPKRSRIELLAKMKLHAERVAAIARHQAAVRKSYAMFGTSTTQSLQHLSEKAEKRRDQQREERCEQLEKLPVEQREVQAEADKRRAEYLARVKEQVVSMRGRYQQPDGGEGEEDDDGAYSDRADDGESQQRQQEKADGGGDDVDDQQDDASSQATDRTGGSSSLSPSEQQRRRDEQQQQRDAAEKPKVWQTETGEFGYRVLTVAELREKREQQREKHAQQQLQAIVTNAELVEKFRVETLEKQEQHLHEAVDNREGHRLALQKHLEMRREHREEVRQNAVKQFNEEKKAQLEPFDKVLRQPSFIHLFDVDNNNSSSRYDFGAEQHKSLTSFPNQSLSSANALDADGVALAEIQQQQQDDKKKKNNSNKKEEEEEDLVPPKNLVPHFAEPFHRIDAEEARRRSDANASKKTAPMMPKPSTLPRQEQNKILARAKHRIEVKEQQTKFQLANHAMSIGGEDAVTSRHAPARSNSPLRSSSPAAQKNTINSDLPPSDNLLASYTDTEQYGRAKSGRDERRERTEERLQLADQRRRYWSMQRKVYFQRLHLQQEMKEEKANEHVERHYAQLEAKASKTAGKVASGLSAAEERRAEAMQQRAARARVIGTEMNALARTEREVLEQLDVERGERLERERQQRLAEEAAAAQAAEAAQAEERQRRKSMVLHGGAAAGSSNELSTEDSTFFFLTAAKAQNQSQQQSKQQQPTPPVTSFVPPPQRQQNTQAQRELERKLEEEQRKERMTVLLETALAKSKPSANQELFLPPVEPVCSPRHQQPSNSAASAGAHSPVVVGAVAQSAREEQMARQRRSQILQRQMSSKLQQQEMEVASHLAASFEKSRAAKHQGAPSFTVRPPPTARKPGVSDPSAPPRFTIQPTSVKNVLK